MRKFTQNKLFLPFIVLILFFFFLVGLWLIAGSGPLMLVFLGNKLYHIHHDLMGLILILVCLFLMKINYFENPELNKVLKWGIILGIILIIQHILFEGLIFIDVFPQSN
ncbi:MAG: hypothetical protein ABIA76_05000 [Candidatus Diapherotrites archaeon]